ncbi:MAG: BRCT domain-containing protein [Bacteroidetes bacterium]|nr:BRCT domain-containing protein [Bacteroidota bacterium]
MANNKIKFKDKTFLFTGTMVDIERKDAEKEVKLRGGYPAKGVSKTLNYLVIGSVPNKDWKFGNYGNKINETIQLRNSGVNIQIVSEDEFINGLCETEPQFDSKSLEKILLIRFGFLLKQNSQKLSDLENIVADFANTNALYLDKSYFILDVYSDLYLSFKDIDISIIDLIVDFRLIKHLDAANDVSKTVKDCFNLYSMTKLTPKDFNSHEWKEGTSVFMKLLKELPKDHKLTKK